MIKKNTYPILIFMQYVLLKQKEIENNQSFTRY